MEAQADEHVAEDQAVHSADSPRAARIVRKDGRSVDVLCSSSPIVRDGRRDGELVIFRDRGQTAPTRRRPRSHTAHVRPGEQLQRALLPALLPEVPGLDVAVSYRPTGPAALIGGDFYDVIPSRSGRLLALGDVRGKGEEAAGVAAMVRYLLRGAARQRADVPSLLSTVNRELLEHPAGRFCTSILVEVHAEQHGRVQASISCAGHPSALLVRQRGALRPSALLIPSWASSPARSSSTPTS